MHNIIRSFSIWRGRILVISNVYQFIELVMDYTSQLQQLQLKAHISTVKENGAVIP